LQGKTAITKFLVFMNRLFKIKSGWAEFNIVNEAVVYSPVLMERLAGDIKHRSSLGSTDEIAYWEPVQ
jgi:hypothetical protein